jgi:hypothetical protein
LIICIAAAGMCVALVTRILLYSDTSDRPTIRELPDLEAAPSSPTHPAELELPPQTAPIPPRPAATAPPQTAPAAPPQTSSTVPAQTAPMVPPETVPTVLPRVAPSAARKLNLEELHHIYNGIHPLAKRRHHPTPPPASIPDWSLSNDPPPSERQLRPEVPQ